MTTEFDLEDSKVPIPEFYGTTNSLLENHKIIRTEISPSKRK